ncbi:hypothetical protein KCU81_g534, partial [Aureobasidium melanogenum]
MSRKLRCGGLTRGEKGGPSGVHEPWFEGVIGVTEAFLHLLEQGVVEHRLMRSVDPGALLVCLLHLRMYDPLLLAHASSPPASVAVVQVSINVGCCASTFRIQTPSLSADSIEACANSMISERTCDGFEHVSEAFGSLARQSTLRKALICKIGGGFSSREPDSVITDHRCAAISSCNCRRHGRCEFLSRKTFVAGLSPESVVVQHVQQGCHVSPGSPYVEDERYERRTQRDINAIMFNLFMFTKRVHK